MEPTYPYVGKPIPPKCFYFSWHCINNTGFYSVYWPSSSLLSQVSVIALIVHLCNFVMLHRPSPPPFSHIMSVIQNKCSISLFKWSIDIVCFWGSVYHAWLPPLPLLSIWSHGARASQSAIPASPFLDHLLANTWYFHVANSQAAQNCLAKWPETTYSAGPYCGSVELCPGAKSA